jgi:anti-sigma factor RsiW
MTDTEIQLLAYADGELDAEETAEVERLLETDPRAQRQLGIYRKTAMLLRAACAEGFYRDVPEKLVTTVQRDRPSSLVPRRWMLAVAASLLLGVFGFAAGYGIGTRPASTYEALVSEIAQYHPIYAHDAAHLVEIPASRVKDLEAWINERIGRKLAVPDLSSIGFDFAGGRMLVVNGQSVGQILYTRPGMLPLGICVAALAGAPQPERIVHHSEANVISWSDGSYAYVVVGDVPDSMLHAVATRISAELRDGA